MSTNALFALQEMYPPPHMILMYPPPHINDVHQRSICTTTLVAVSPATHGSAGLFPQETRHAAQLGALCFSLLLSSLMISSLYYTHAPQLLHASQPTCATHIYVSSPSPSRFLALPQVPFSIQRNALVTRNPFAVTA